MIYTSGDDDDDDTSIDLFCNNKKFFIRNVIHVNGVTGSTLGENPIPQFSTYSYIIWFSRIVTLPCITWCKKFGKNLNPGKIRIFSEIDYLERAPTICDCYVSTTGTVALNTAITSSYAGNSRGSNFTFENEKRPF